MCVWGGGGGGRVVCVRVCSVCAACMCVRYSFVFHYWSVLCASSGICNRSGQTFSHMTPLTFIILLDIIKALAEGGIYENMTLF